MGPSGAVMGPSGAVGSIPGPLGAVKGRWGPSGADGPKVTFHRAVLYVYKDINLIDAKLFKRRRAIERKLILQVRIFTFFAIFL